MSITRDDLSSNLDLHTDEELHQLLLQMDNPTQQLDDEIQEPSQKRQKHQSFFNDTVTNHLLESSVGDIIPKKIQLEMKKSCTSRLSQLVSKVKHDKIAVESIKLNFKNRLINSPLSVTFKKFQSQYPKEAILAVCIPVIDNFTPQTEDRIETKLSQAIRIIIKNATYKKGRTPENVNQEKQRLISRLEQHNLPASIKKFLVSKDQDPSDLITQCKRIITELTFSISTNLIPSKKSLDNSKDALVNEIKNKCRSSLYLWIKGSNTEEEILKIKEEFKEKFSITSIPNSYEKYLDNFLIQEIIDICHSVIDHYKPRSNKLKCTINSITSYLIYNRLNNPNYQDDLEKIKNNLISNLDNNKIPKSIVDLVLEHGVEVLTEFKQTIKNFQVNRKKQKNISGFITLEPANSLEDGENNLELPFVNLNADEDFLFNSEILGENWKETIDKQEIVPATLLPEHDFFSTQSPSLLFQQQANEKTVGILEKEASECQINYSLAMNKPSSPTD